MTGLNLHSFNHENDALLEQMKNVVERYCPEELKEERRALISDEELHLESLFQGFDQLLSDGAIPSEALFPPASKAEVDRRQSDIIVPNELGNGFGVGIPETDKLRDFNYDETDTLNEDQIRRDFPILSQRVNGHPLVWLDNGATTQKPQTVIDEIGRYYSTYNSNIHRGAHTLAARATDAYEAAREKVRRFIHAPSSKNILFVRGTTEGINLIAQTFGRQYLTPGDNVIVSTLDHHANIVPWQQVARERGAELRAIPVDANGDLILSEL